ncbi:MAG: zinc ribbon domain-containing protein [Bacilli bacterium]|nr:zinc ribbon domain-containing protein [Bacilli bacterium]
MFCSNCGNQLEENAKFCKECGEKVESKKEKKETKESGEHQHDVPKCTHCGYVGQWEVGPVFRSMDYIIGICFLILGVVPGLVYLGVVGAIRSNPDNREKTCPKCKAKNLWTFFYKD